MARNGFIREKESERLAADMRGREASASKRAEILGPLVAFLMVSAFVVACIAIIALISPSLSLTVTRPDFTERFN